MKNPSWIQLSKKFLNREKRLMAISIYSVIWHFYFDIFALLTKNDAFTRLNIIIFVFSRSILVEIDTSLALFQKNFFLVAISIFFLKRGLPYWRKLPTDLADFKKQTAEDIFLPPLKFWGKLEQNCDLDSAPTKSAKWPLWRHRFGNFQIREKLT